MHMLNLTVHWWELVIRSIVVFVVLLFLLRLTGKRQVGQLAPNDFVLLLILANAVQNSMNAGDNSLIGGLISALTLVFLNYCVNKLILKNKKIENLIEGRPQILIKDGKLFDVVMLASGITREEINGVIRQHGCDDVKDVQLAILETNGSISVLIKHE
jgi:uncharacterized membrane protein YcaP (DUF421 family)